jgi:hypothetical protein
MGNDRKFYNSRKRYIDVWKYKYGNGNKIMAEVDVMCKIVKEYNELYESTEENRNVVLNKDYIIEGNLVKKDSKIILESHGSDLPNVDKYADPLSKIKGKGLERIDMDYRDNHQAWFYDGQLCGFSWFGKISSGDYYEIMSKNYSRVVNDGLGAFVNSRPATMFVELYGKEGQRLLDEAIERVKQKE